jgi:hypothetical protein
MSATNVDKKPFVCIKCKRIFGRSCDLDRHMRKKIPCDRVIKCDKCDKLFKTVTILRKHENRKTSCAPIKSNPANPLGKNGCRFCYKLMSNKYTLRNHYKTCKIKNGGVELLFNKLEEHHRELTTVTQENALIRAELKQLKESMSKPSNQVNTLGNNNTITTNQAYVTINNYKTPNLDDIKVALRDLLKDKLLKTVMESIYFNPSKPENHSILSQNIKQKRVAVFEDGWKLLTSERERGKVIDDVKAVCLREGGKILSSNDSDDSKTTPVEHQRIRSFNQLNREEADMTDEEVLETFYKHRDMVIKTKKTVSPP